MLKLWVDDVYGKFPKMPPAIYQAAIAEATGEWAKAVVQYGEAASAWEGFHAPYDQARALLGQGRCLLRAGWPYEAHVATVATARPRAPSSGTRHSAERSVIGS